MQLKLLYKFALTPQPSPQTLQKSKFKAFQLVKLLENRKEKFKKFFKNKKFIKRKKINLERKESQIGSLRIIQLLALYKPSQLRRLCEREF